MERMFFAVERRLFGVERRVFCCRPSTYPFVCLQHKFFVLIFCNSPLTLNFDFFRLSLNRSGVVDFSHKMPLLIFECHPGTKHVYLTMWNHVSNGLNLLHPQKVVAEMVIVFCVSIIFSQGFHVCNKIRQTLWFSKLSFFLWFSLSFLAYQVSMSEVERRALWICKLATSPHRATTRPCHSWPAWTEKQSIYSQEKILPFLKFLTRKRVVNWDLPNLTISDLAVLGLQPSARIGWLGSLASRFAVAEGEGMRLAQLAGWPPAEVVGQVLRIPDLLKLSENKRTCTINIPHETYTTTQQWTSTGFLLTLTILTCALWEIKAAILLQHGPSAPAPPRQAVRLRYAPQCFQGFSKR